MLAAETLQAGSGYANAAIAFLSPRERVALGALAGPNPQPKQAEVIPFTDADLEKLAVELGRWAPFALVGAETGLRPAELAGLEWRDIDENEHVVIVERAFTSGELKSYGKTVRARRRVPLTKRAGEAFEAIPRRLDTRAVFASPRSHRLDLHNFRGREWIPAVEAAGIGSRRIYDLRHTFATNALAAGVTLLELSRYRGTSVELLDRTYGHLAQGAEDRARRLLDAHAGNRLGQDWAGSGEDR